MFDGEVVLNYKNQTVQTLHPLFILCEHKENTFILLKVLGRTFAYLHSEALNLELLVLKYSRKKRVELNISMTPLQSLFHGVQQGGHLENGRKDLGL